MHLSHLHLQKAWLTIMDPTLEAQNWFKKYEHSLGNANFLLKYAMLMILILSIVSAVLRTLKLLFIERVVVWFVSLILTIGASFIWYKLRNYHYDTLGIRKEMSTILKFAVISLIVALTMVLLLEFNIIPFEIYDILWCYTVCILLTGLTVFSTLLPRKLSNTGHIIRVKTTNRYFYKCSLAACFDQCCLKCFGMSSLINRKTHTAPTGNDNNDDDVDIASVAGSTGRDSSGGSGNENENNTLNLTISLRDLPAFGPGFSSRSTSGLTTSFGSGFSSGNIHSINSRSPTSNSAMFGTRWQHIVCVPFGYEALMLHLETEFAIENLLFISEVCLLVLYVCLCV